MSYHSSSTQYAPEGFCRSCGFRGKDWSFKFVGYCTNCHKRWKKGQADSLREIATEAEFAGFDSLSNRESAGLQPTDFDLNWADIDYVENIFPEFESRTKGIVDFWEGSGSVIGLLVGWFLFADAGLSTGWAFLVAFLTCNPLGLWLGSLIGKIIRNSREGALSRPSGEVKEKVKQFRSARRDQEIERRKIELQKQRRRESYWKNMDGRKFEIEMAQIFERLGYKTTLTAVTGDRGIDIDLEKDEIKTCVQCKAHNKPVGVATIRDLFGTMHAYNYPQGIVASTSGYTDGAQEFPRGKNIQLMDLDEILKHS